MRKKGAYLILSLAAALFMLFCFSASAQDVDIDNMTNEQRKKLPFIAVGIPPAIRSYIPYNGE